MSKNYPLSMGLFKCPPKSFYPMFDPFFHVFRTEFLGQIRKRVDHRMKALDVENTDIKHMIYAG